jgi:hypothetical protein
LESFSIKNELFFPRHPPLSALGSFFFPNPLPLLLPTPYGRKKILLASLRYAKLAVKATTIADIPRLIFQALAVATSERPGGCYLDIPSVVLYQTIPESKAVNFIVVAAADSAASNPSPPKHKSLDEGIQKVVDPLHRAVRPLSDWEGRGVCAREGDHPKAGGHHRHPLSPDAHGEGSHA